MSKKMTKEKLEEVIPQCINIAQVLNKLEMSATTANYKAFNDSIKKYNLDISHFLGQKSGSVKASKILIPIEEILVENSIRPFRSDFKKRVITLGLLENKCALCPIIDTWNGKSIVLQIDHINGRPNDHRIENLRLLCPNCHSQTDNFCGKNRTSSEEDKKATLCDCGNEKLKRSKVCISCSSGSRRDENTKINWPNDEELISMLTISSWAAVSRKLGVSDNSIRSRLRVRGLFEKVIKIKSN